MSKIQCKPFLIESIDAIINSYKQKERLHPSHQRNKFSQLIEWMIERFSNLKSLCVKSDEISTQNIMEEQKKIVVSSFIEMIQLLSNECQEKGTILKIIMQYTLQTINSLTKSLQKITNRQFFQMVTQNQRIERANFQQIKQLQRQNLQYKREKQHKWKNMFMVVKDNRVLKKQKMKLVKKLKQQHWNIKFLNQEIVNLKGQNQKYKLIISSQQNPTKLNAYIHSKLKLGEMEKRIADYPKHAKRILMKQLERIQINQFNTLDQKIQYIINAIDVAGEVVDAEDDFDQVQTNNKMYYNAFAQTENQFKQVSTSTIDVKTGQKFTQVSLANLSSNFKLDSAIFNEKGYYFKIERSKVKGKTTIAVDFQMGKFYQNRKEKNTISNLEVSLNFDPSELNNKTNNIKTILKDKDNNLGILNCMGKKSQTTSNNSQETQNQHQNNQNQQSKSNLKFKVNDASQPKQQTVEFNRSYFKRGSWLANAHTVSSKKKLRDNFSKHVLKQWKIKKVFDISVNKLNVNKESQCEYDNESNRKKSIDSSDSQSSNDSKSQQSYLKKMHKKTSRLSIHPTHLQELQKIKAQYPHLKKSNAKNKQRFKIKQENTNQNQIKNDEKIGKQMGDKRQSQSSMNSVATRQQNNIKINKKQFTNLNRISKKDFFLKKKNYRQSQNSQNFNVLPSKFLKQKQNRLASFSNSPTGFYNSLLNNHKRQSKNSLLLSDKSNNSIKKQHFRTKTQGVQQILQLSEQLQNKFAPTEKQILRKNSIKTSQSASHVIKPVRRMATQIFNKVQLFQNIQKVKIKQKGIPLSQIDLLKSIDKIIKNINQRAIQIFKNKYTLKQFLVTYYQQNYGDHLRSVQQFLIQMNCRKYYNDPIVQAFSILMNTQANEKYLQDIFKIFATIIQRNGGILSKNLGASHNKQLTRFVLGWFFDQQKIDQIIKGLCIQVLNGSIIDYFIAIQAQIRKNTLNSKLYKFLKGFILPSQNTISYQLLKEISFSLKNSQSLISKSKMLLNLKVLTEQNIQLHRLPLIIAKIKWINFLILPQHVQQKYLKMFGCYSQQDVINECSRSKTFVINFPVLKSIFDRKVQNYYTHNIEISRQFLMLCKLILIENQIERSLQSQIPMTLKCLHERYEYIDSKQFYQKLVAQN